MTMDSTSPAGRRTEMRSPSDRTKVEHVSELLETLREDLASRNLCQEERRAALEQLKIYGRDPKDAELIFREDSIEVLAKHAFAQDASPSSLEALRCLANAMLLNPKIRQIFVTLGYSGQAAERLKSQDSDYEFLISRMLFLMTYECKLNFDPLFNNHALGESINAHIARHAKQFTESDKTNQLDPIHHTALSETLKLVFNLSSYYPHRIPTLKASTDNIFMIFNNITLPTPPLQPPIDALINAFLILDFPSHHLTTHTIKNLTTILHLSLTHYPPTTLDPLLIPLLTLLRKIHASTPQLLPTLLLPSSTDRNLPLGQSSTLPSLLLRLSTSPSAPRLREAISSLLFELSNKDPNTFVRNVGYGYAAGFLMSHDIPIPESAGQAHRTPQTRSSGHMEEEDDEGDLVNPVTGQKLSKEEPVVDTGPAMTEEEKEREAERLFVLFERLRATGVVEVGNPVREAVEAGRFEESGGKKDAGGRVEEVDDN